ncbi:MAG: hypothetical protein JW937_09550 [Candidatus Omnitrophica bacterium]|nr:hypothetical protein [Candidatus Omnitrophota bacterium]
MSQSEKYWPEQTSKQFNTAFAVMSVIPLLICCYLITVRIVSVERFIGLDGFYFLMGIIFALLGLAFGRGMMKHIMKEVLEENRQLKEQLKARSGQNPADAQPGTFE